MTIMRQEVPIPSQSNVKLILPDPRGMAWASWALVQKTQVKFKLSHGKAFIVPKEDIPALEELIAQAKKEL